MGEPWSPRDVHLCAECGVEEGHFHRPGCLWATCNHCGGQYVTCGCPPHRRKRTRFIVYPNMCGRCGEAFPAMFQVSNKEWNATVAKGERHLVLCLTCFAFLRHIQGLPPAQVTMLRRFTSAAEHLAHLRGITAAQATAMLTALEQP